MTKKMFTAMVPLPAMVKHRCAWRNCRQTFEITGSDPPPGWRWLALWAGPVGAPPWASGNIEDRDALLCPKHAAQLHNEVLEDIGQRLYVTEGNA